MKHKSIIEKVLKLIKDKGVLRPRDLDEYNIPREYLRRLYKRGVIIRVGRGLYELNNIDITENHSLIQLQTRVPQGVFCLLSSLQFHGITTQMPHAMWMAIESATRKPKIEFFNVKFVHFSKESFEEGVEKHIIENSEIKVFCVAKTVVDMFKFRSKVGLDVAIEALQETLKDKIYTIDELYHYAKICRMQKIMKPYIEALL